MKPILRFLGRLIFATILISAALMRLSVPQQSKMQLQNNYRHIASLTKNLGFNILPPIHPKISMNSPALKYAAQAWSGIEIIIAILILFSDRKGSTILLSYLVIEGLVCYGFDLVTMRFIYWNVFLKFEFSRYLSILGLALCLSNKISRKKKPFDSA